MPARSHWAIPLAVGALAVSTALGVYFGVAAGAVRPARPGAVSSGAVSSGGSSAGSRSVPLAPARLTGTVARPCGRLARPPARFRHVIWIWMENHSLSQVVGARGAAFETWLARRCGLAVDYHAITHPSLPNYLAATSGSTHGVTDDGYPSEHPIRTQSIFGQIQRARLSWRSYEESMPGNCFQVSAGSYAVKHNPAAYYVRIRGGCRSWDVSMGGATGRFAHVLRTGRLPSFAFVTPNICDDDHNCPVSSGDRWLSVWVRRILASPAYRAGGTALFITFDEGDVNQVVPLIVVAPSVHPGRRVAVPLTHYSLLRSTEGMLGLAPLANAARARSLTARFNL